MVHKASLQEATQLAREASNWEGRSTLYHCILHQHLVDNYTYSSHTQLYVDFKAAFDTISTSDI